MSYLVESDLFVACTVTAALVIVELAVWLAISGRKRRSDSGGVVLGSRIAGAVGVVVVTIPEGGVGAIALVLGGKRLTIPARADGGGELAAGVEVAVVEIEGTMVTVAAL